MWYKATPTTMQEFDSYCDKMEINQTLTLQDTRDKNNYTVAKLKDGKCWMTQNLRIGSNSKSITLYPSDSDVNSNYSLPQGNINGFVAGTYNSPRIYIDSDIDYGGYYNWSAANAGSTLTVGNAPYSICPKGWKIPSLDELNIFASLYTLNELQSLPANFKNYPGEFWSGTAVGKGTTTWYWSSTANGSDAGILFYTNNYAKPTTLPTQNGNGKQYGDPVRCISRY